MRPALHLACAVATAAAFAASAAGARLVSPGFSISWGKAGVTLTQYRADAIACGQNAAATDLSNTDPAKALVIGSRLIGNDRNPVASPVVDPMK